MNPGKFIEKTHDMLEQQLDFFTLDNGLKVAYLQTNTKVAHIGISIMAGSRFEEVNENGIAHLLEHCLFLFPEFKRFGQIFRNPINIEELGGELNAFTDNEEICVHASIIHEHIPIAISELAQIIKNTKFSEEDLEKEKEIVFDEINSYNDIPFEKIQQDFMSLMFNNHSLGRSISGTKASVKSISKKQLLAYREKYFCPTNIVISFVGSNDITEIKKLIEENFGGIKKSNFKNENVAFTNYQVFKKSFNYKFSQMHVYVGGIGPHQKHKDKAGLTLLMNYLGGLSSNSLLGMKLRQDKGYTYHIEAELNSFIDCGYWSIYFTCDNKNYKQALALVYEELENLCTKKINAKILKIAKEQLKGNIALSLDSNNGLMIELGRNYLFYNKIDSIEESYAIIDQITAKELMMIANKYLHPKNCSELIYK